jgi:hypothetical protein
VHVVIHCVSSRVDVPMLAAVPVPVHRGELHGPGDQALGADAAACAGVAVVGVTDVAGAGVGAVQLKYQTLQLWAEPTCVVAITTTHTVSTCTVPACSGLCNRLQPAAISSIGILALGLALNRPYCTTVLCTAGGNCPRSVQHTCTPKCPQLPTISHRS